MDIDLEHQYSLPILAYLVEASRREMSSPFSKIIKFAMEKLLGSDIHEIASSVGDYLGVINGPENGSDKGCSRGRLVPPSDRSAKARKLSQATADEVIEVKHFGPRCSPNRLSLGEMRQHTRASFRMSHR
jgi:hypothetical protein